MDRPIVVLDTETATLPRRSAPARDRGACASSTARSSTSSRRSCARGARSSPRRRAIHGIARRGRARRAGRAARCWRASCAWLGDDWMAAHDAPIRRARAGLRVRPRRASSRRRRRSLDTLQLARKLIPEAPDHKLSTLCQLLELEDGPSTTARSPDAVSCWKVLEACVERIAGRADATVRPSACWRSAGGAATRSPAAAPRLPRLAPRLRPLERGLRQRRDASRSSTATEERSPRASRRASCSRAAAAATGGRVRALGLLKTYRLDRVRDAWTTLNDQRCRDARL